MPKDYEKKINRLLKQYEDIEPLHDEETNEFFNALILDEYKKG